jgi:hypothetical protein
VCTIDFKKINQKEKKERYSPDVVILVLVVLNSKAMFLEREPFSIIRKNGQTHPPASMIMKTKGGRVEGGPTVSDEHKTRDWKCNMYICPSSCSTVFSFFFFGYVCRKNLHINEKLLRKLEKSRRNDGKLKN